MEATSGINLLPELTEKEIKSGVYKRKAVVASIVALVALGLIIVGLLAYQIFLSARAKSIENRSKAAEAGIVENRDIEISNLALKDKLDKIEGFLTSQIPTSTLIQEVTTAAQTSNPITILGLSVESNGDFVVNGKALGSQFFEEWINNLTSENGTEYFAKINMTSLTGKPGDYDFSFRMTFLKKGVYDLNSQQSDEQ